MRKELFICTLLFIMCFVFGSKANRLLVTSNSNDIGIQVADTVVIEGLGNWKGGGNKSLTLPRLYKLDNQLLIYSEKYVDNLYMGITDSSNQLIFSETITIPTDSYYCIDVSSLVDDELYYLYLIRGGDCLYFPFYK